MRHRNNERHTEYVDQLLKMKQQLFRPEKNYSLGFCDNLNKFQGSNLPNRPIPIKQRGAHSPFQDDDQHSTQVNTKRISGFIHEIDAKKSIDYISQYQPRCIASHCWQLHFARVNEVAVARTSQ